MRVAILGTLMANGGDAAITLALVEGLRARLGEGTEFVLYDQRPAMARAHYPGLAIRESVFMASGAGVGSGVGRRMKIRRLRLAARLWRAGWKRSARALAGPLAEDLDLLGGAALAVATGGTYLVEHYSLAPRILEYEITRRLGRPIAFFTQSLGPFNFPWHRRVLAEVIGEAPLVLLRDRRSMENLKALGIDTGRCAVAPDSVFALGAAVEGGKVEEEGPRVAVSVREWRHYKGMSAEVGERRYLGAVARAVERLVERCGARVTFVSTCQGIGGYLDDSKVARRVMEMLRPEAAARVTVDTEFHDPRRLREMLGGYDAVISTRMHMAILALTAGRPVLAIAYEFKTRELFDGLGMGEWAMEIDGIDAEALAELAERLVREGEAVAAQVRAGTTPLRAGAEAAMDRLAAVARAAGAEQAGGGEA